jgi:uncharacterized protein (UPF0548 family)
MFFRSKPSRASIDAFITAQRNANFSYAEVGQSRHHAPTSYTLDHNRMKLGEGAGIFEKAKHSLVQWKMFDIPWIELCWPDTPITPGANIAVLASHLGFWSLNPCRVVYVLDEGGPIEKYGFAYGTSSGHAEFGEERFAVEFDARDQAVWYDIYAFSRPTAPARVVYPFTRRLQKRFARDSKIAMFCAVQNGE